LRGGKMIFHPQIGMKARCHYRDGHPAYACQGIQGVIDAVSTGPGPRNVRLKVPLFADDSDLHYYEIVPRGNLVRIDRFSWEE